MSVHLLHKNTFRGNVKPRPDQLQYGELGLQYHHGQVALWTKDSDGEVVRIAYADDPDAVPPELYGYATEQWVLDQNYLTIDDLPEPPEEINLDGYATEEWVNEQSFVSEAPADSRQYIRIDETWQEVDFTNAGIPEPNDDGLVYGRKYIGGVGTWELIESVSLDGLQEQIDQEVKDREDGDQALAELIEQEKQYRVEGDADLQSQIDALETGNASLHIQDDPPKNPKVGMFWLDSTRMEVRVYYDDGVDSQQWVPVSISYGGVQEGPDGGGEDYNDAEIRALLQNETEARINADDALDARVTQNESDIAALQAGGGGGFSGDYDDLTNKPDLTEYAKTDDLADVATSGSYNDLADTPSIPTATSELTNDSGFLTANYTGDAEITGTLTATAFVGDGSGLTGLPTGGGGFSGDYDDLTNKPDLTAYAETSYVDSADNALNGLIAANTQALEDLADVASSGSYGDLTDTPAIPKNTSDLTNDSGFLTDSHTGDAEITGTLTATSFVGDGSGLTGLPSGGASDLAGLSDVNLNDPKDGNVLSYAGGQWVNSAAPPADISGSSISALNDVETAGATEGDLLQLKSGVWVPYTPPPAVDVSDLEQRVADLEAALATVLKLGTEYEGSLVTVGQDLGENNEDATFASTVKFTAVS